MSGEKETPTWEEIEPEPAKEEDSVPQLSDTQKAMVRTRHENLILQKIRLADALALLRQCETEVSQAEQLFRGTCESALQGVGIDLNGPDKYQINLDDFSVTKST